MIFKSYLKLVPRYLPNVILYIAIFAALITMIIKGSDNIGSGSGGFDGFSANAAVRDLDQTEESKALLSFLESAPNISLTDIDFSRENAIQDSLYHRKAEYILTIEKGFGESLSTDNTRDFLKSDVIEGSSSQMFVENEINSYMNAARLYIIAGEDSLSALTKAKANMENGVKITNYQQQAGWNEENKEVYLFYNYIPYIFIMMILGILVPTLTTFFNNEMRSRSLCSPVSPAAYTAQVIGGALVVALLVSGVLMLVGVPITGGKIFAQINGYAIIQAVIFMLFCVSVSGLVGVLCSSKKKAANYVTSIVSNIMGLGMAFMCGVFVKQSLLGDGVLNAAKLLPVYWYVRGNNMIFGGDGQVFDKEQVIICIVIELLFAVAVLAAALLAAAIKKGKRSE